MRASHFLYVLPLALVACTKAPPPPTPASSASADDESAALEKLKKLTVEEVDRHVQAKDPRFFVFDANMPEVFAKGHVPGATLVPEGGVTANLLPTDKSATLVFYCSNEH